MNQLRKFRIPYAIFTSLTVASIVFLMIMMLETNVDAWKAIVMTVCLSIALLWLGVMSFLRYEDPDCFYDQQAEHPILFGRPGFAPKLFCEMSDFERFGVVWGPFIIDGIFFAFGLGFGIWLLVLSH